MWMGFPAQRVVNAVNVYVSGHIHGILFQWVIPATSPIYLKVYVLFGSFWPFVSSAIHHNYSKWQVSVPGMEIIYIALNWARVRLRFWLVIHTLLPVHFWHSSYLHLIPISHPIYCAFIVITIISILELTSTATNLYFIDDTGVPWRLKSPKIVLFNSPFKMIARTQSMLRITVYLRKEPHKGLLVWKGFPCKDALMRKGILS